MLTAVVLSGLMANAALAAYAPPSSNDINRESGWGHVNLVDAGSDYVTLQLVSPDNTLSCFEYRTDGDVTQKLGDWHFNGAVEDGLYPYVCLQNTSIVETLFADQYVEVRLVFGGYDRARDFDWTRFDVAGAVPPAPDPLPSGELSGDDCKKGGWADHGFRNQGQCIRFVETGKDSRPPAAEL